MSIWGISSEEEFERVAIETFRFQAASCEPYRKYLEMVECDLERVSKIAQIPFLPIELFKSCNIYIGDDAPEAIFTSSGDVASHHPMRSLAHYERCCIEGFTREYGDPADWSIYALLPSYLERTGSSLIYMVERLIARAEGAGGGFFLTQHAEMVEAMSRDSRPKILLGVSYALLDLVESGVVREPLHDTIVMETGGMKGRREELSKRELHSRLCEGLGVERIHSEYGMAELTSQGYSKGDGIFRCPPWMGVVVRDLADPFALSNEGRGGINIIDLASRYSCSFIATQDLGELLPDGSFKIEGRISGSDIRGCNLLIS